MDDAVSVVLQGGSERALLLRGVKPFGS